MGPGSGGDQARSGRVVEVARSVSARPDDVDDGNPDVDRHRRGPHRLDEPGHLLDGLTLDAQGHDERRDLRRRRLPGHDLGHRRPRILSREILAGGQGSENGWPMHPPMLRRVPKSSYRGVKFTVPRIGVLSAFGHRPSDVGDRTRSWWVTSEARQAARPWAKDASPGT